MKSAFSGSFPVLVASLAEEHHQGALLRMSVQSGIPQSTLWRWVRGLPSKYTPALIRRFAEYYNLKFPDVWELIQRDEATRLAGKKIVLPDVSRIKRGPVPRTTER